MMNSSLSTPICLATEEGDSASFGHALAVSDRYLAIGDPDANRVVIYHHAENNWVRLGIVSPPEGSPAHNVGAGFGYNIGIDGDILVVGAYLEQHQSATPEMFQWTNQLGVSFSGSVYQVRLQNVSAIQPNQVRRIDVLEDNVMAGFAVAVAGNTIAFSARHLNRSDVGDGLVYVLANSSFNAHNPFTRITPPTPSSAPSFGIDIALNHHHLLVGAPFDGDGSAWLFALDSPNSSPHRLAIDDANIGSSVALSDTWAVAGALVGGDRAAIPVQTLLWSLPNRTSIVLDGYGQLRLVGDRLLRVRSRSPDGEANACMDLFDLSDLSGFSDPTSPMPEPIMQRNGIDRAQMTHKFLAYRQKTAAGPRICIERQPG